jgi:hypothetical protein
MLTVPTFGVPPPSSVATTVSVLSTKLSTSGTTVSVVLDWPAAMVVVPM